MFRLKLEVFRMIVYLSFPVGMFWLAGETQIYQTLTRPKLFPPERDYMRMELEDFKERLRKEKEAKRLAEAKE